MNEKGNTTVLMVVLMPVFILFMGWSIDVGRVISAKVELYKATDIAARELAKDIDMSEASESGRQVRLDMKQKARDYIDKNTEGLCGGKVVAVQVRGDVRIVCRAEIPLYFSLGKIKTTRIKVQSLGRLRKIK